MLKTKESKEIFAASEYDYSMAMFSALRDAGKDAEFILKKLNEEGKRIHNFALRISEGPARWSRTCNF